MKRIIRDLVLPILVNILSKKTVRHYLSHNFSFLESFTFEQMCYLKRTMEIHKV